MKPGDKESSCCISTYSIATLYLRVHERKKERKKEITQMFSFSVIFHF